MPTCRPLLPLLLPLLLACAGLPAVECLHLDFDKADDWTAQPGWVSVPATTATATAAAGTVDFAVGEPQRAMVWSHAADFTVAGQVTDLSFRYRVVNAHPEVGAVLTFDAGPAAAAFSVPLASLNPDGGWHECLAIVPRGRYVGISLKVQSADAGLAHLVVDHVLIREAAVAR